MTKSRFLKSLKKAMRDYPSETVKKTVDYYDEMISDRMEDGLSEEAAVKAMQSVEEIVRDIPNENAGKPRGHILHRPFSGREIALLIISFPIWLPLCIGALALGIAMLAVILSLLVSIVSVWFALAAGAVGGVVTALIALFGGDVVQSLVILGAALVCGGLALLLAEPFKRLARTLLKACRNILKIKRT